MRVRLNLDNSEEYSGMDEATSEDLAFPSLLGGGTASLSPFRRSPRSAYGSLPPLLGQDLHSCPATKGAYPLGIPTDLCPLSRPQINQKRLGFRLRSPHLFGEEPCPLRLQTVFSPTALRLTAEKVDEGMA